MGCNLCYIFLLFSISILCFGFSDNVEVDEVWKQRVLSYEQYFNDAHDALFRGEKDGEVFRRSMQPFVGSINPTDPVLVSSLSSDDFRKYADKDHFGVDESLTVFHKEELSDKQIHSLTRNFKKNVTFSEAYTGGHTMIQYDMNVLPGTFNLDIWISREMMTCKNGGIDKMSPANTGYLYINVKRNVLSHVKNLHPGTRITSRYCDGFEETLLYGVVIWREFVRHGGERTTFRIHYQKSTLEEMILASSLHIEHFPGDEEKIEKLKNFENSNQERRLVKLPVLNFKKEFNWNYDKARKRRKKNYNLLKKSGFSVDCSDCYLYFYAGFKFKSEINVWDYTTVDVGLKGIIKMKMELTATFDYEGHSDTGRKALVNKFLVGAVPVTLIIPLTLKFYLSLKYRVKYDVSAHFSITQSFKFSLDSSFSYKRNDKGKSYFIRKFNPKFAVPSPEITASGSLSARFELVPVFTVSFIGVCSADMSIFPYLEFAGRGDLDEGVVESSKGLIFGLSFQGTFGKMKLGKYTLTKGYKTKEYRIFSKVLCCKGELLTKKSNVKPASGSDSGAYNSRFGNDGGLGDLFDFRRDSDNGVEFFTLEVGTSSSYINATAWREKYGIIQVVGTKSGENFIITVNCVGTCSFSLGVCSSYESCTWNAGNFTVENTYLEDEEFLHKVGGGFPGIRMNLAEQQEAQLFSFEIVEVFDSIEVYSEKEVKIPKGRCLVYQFPDSPRQLFYDSSKDLIVTFSSACDPSIGQNLTYDDLPGFLINLKVLPFSNLTTPNANVKAIEQTYYTMFLQDYCYEEYVVDVPKVESCLGNYSCVVLVLVRAYSGPVKNVTAKIGLSVTQRASGKSVYFDMYENSPVPRSSIVPVSRFLFEVSVDTPDAVFEWFDVNQVLSVPNTKYVYYGGFLSGFSTYYEEYGFYGEEDFTESSLVFPLLGFSEYYTFVVVGLKNPMVDNWLMKDPSLNETSSLSVFLCGQMFSGYPTDVIIPENDYLSYIYQTSFNPLGTLKILIETEESLKDSTFELLVYAIGEEATVYMGAFTLVTGYEFFTIDPSEISKYYYLVFVIFESNLKEIEITVSNFFSFELDNAFTKEYLENYGLQLSPYEILYFRSEEECTTHPKCYNEYRILSYNTTSLMGYEFYYPYSKTYEEIGKVFQDENYIVGIYGLDALVGVSHHMGEMKYAGLLSLSEESQLFQIEVKNMERCDVAVSFASSIPGTTISQNIEIHSDETKNSWLVITLSTEKCSAAHSISLMQVYSDYGLTEKLLNEYFVGDGNVWNCLKNCFLQSIKPLIDQMQFDDLEDYLVLGGYDENSRPTNVQFSLRVCNTCNFGAGTSLQGNVGLKSSLSLNSTTTAKILESRDDRSSLDGEGTTLVLTVGSDENSTEDDDDTLAIVLGSVFGTGGLLFCVSVVFVAVCCFSLILCLVFGACLLLCVCMIVIGLLVMICVIVMFGLTCSCCFGGLLGTKKYKSLKDPNALLLEENENLSNNLRESLITDSEVEHFQVDSIESGPSVQQSINSVVDDIRTKKKGYVLQE